jgi:hypothetical protein
LKHFKSIGFAGDFGKTGENTFWDSLRKERKVATLIAYHDYLAAHLSFPFKAKWEQETGPLTGATREINVTGFLLPDGCD